MHTRAQPVCEVRGLILLLGAVGVAGGSQPLLCMEGTGILGSFPAVWWGKRSDPCVLLPAGVKKRTKVIKNNVNPVWNEVSVSPSPRGTAWARRVLWDPGASPGKVPQAQGACGGPVMPRGSHLMEGLGPVPITGSFVSEILGTGSGGAGPSQLRAALCSSLFPFHQDLIRAKHAH